MAEQNSNPIPVGAPKAVISAFAERVAGDLNFKASDAIELLVLKLGGTVKYKSPSQGADGRLPESIIVRASDDFTIFLPSMTSPQRDRFTIAHELGHLWLHYPLAAKSRPGVPMTATRWVDESDRDLVRTEWEANWFAAAFLMPAAPFQEAYREGGADYAARKFNVSSHAATVRAKSLSLG
jgi:Zn-dependent peptidase ImmA (M78 family)